MLSFVKALPVESLEPMEEVEREVYDPAKLKRLKEDIRRHGIHNPLHAIKKPKTRDKYEVFIGIHRLMCAKSLAKENKEFSYVPVIIEDIPREEAIAKGFRDNDLQEPVNPMDTAKLIKLLKDGGYTYLEIAKMLFGDEKALSKVKRMVLLLKLPIPVQNRIKEGRIAWSNAFYLLRLRDEQKIIEACEHIIRNDLKQKEILEAIENGHFGETNRKIEGNPTRCFICGELTTYKQSRSKQICLDCLREISKGGLLINREPKPKDVSLLINREEERFINKPKFENEYDKLQWYRQQIKLKKVEAEKEKQREKELEKREKERRKQRLRQKIREIAEQKKREEEKRKFLEKIKKNPLYGLNQDQIAYLKDYAEEQGMSLPEARLELETFWGDVEL